MRKNTRDIWELVRSNKSNKTPALIETYGVAGKTSPCGYDEEKSIRDFTLAYSV